MNTKCKIERCEICEQPIVDVAGFTEIKPSKGYEKYLCRSHSDDLYRWLSEQRKDDRFEIQFERDDKSKYVIIPVAISLVIAGIVYRLLYPINTDPFYIKLLLFFLSLVYIAAFCSPSIYPAILRIGYLRNISLRYYRKMSVTEIITIDATVIAGSIVFLTLLGISQQLPGSSLSNVLGIGDPRSLFSLITATIVAIFAFSAIGASIVKDVEVGRRLMVGGFVYVFFMIFSIAI